MDLSKMRKSKNVEVETDFGSAMAQARLEWINTNRQTHDLPPLDTKKFTKFDTSAPQFNSAEIKKRAKEILNDKNSPTPPSSKGDLFGDGATKDVLKEMGL